MLIHVWKWKVFIYKFFLRVDNIIFNALQISASQRSLILYIQLKTIQMTYILCMYWLLKKCKQALSHFMFSYRSPLFHLVLWVIIGGNLTVFAEFFISSKKMQLSLVHQWWMKQLVYLFFKIHKSSCLKPSSQPCHTMNVPPINMLIVYCWL